MSTTYDRLQVLVGEIRKNELNENPEDPSALAESIATRQLPRLTLYRFNQTLGQREPQSISPAAILRHFGLLEALKLAAFRPERITLTNRGLRALDEDRYSSVITVATEELLSSLGVTKPRLFDAIDSIQPPPFPGADTLHSYLVDKGNIDGNELDVDLFRKLLFLLACGGGIGRVVTVYYEK